MWIYPVATHAIIVPEIYTFGALLLSRPRGLAPPGGSLDFSVNPTKFDELKGSTEHDLCNRIRRKYRNP